MKDLYVVNCCRTAIGSFGGALKNTSATEMGAIVAKEVMKRAGVNPADIDEVMFGDVLSAGLGQNVARQVAVKAGVPYSVPAYTVNMVCGSGMKTMIEAARTILAGDAVMAIGGSWGLSIKEASVSCLSFSLPLIERVMPSGNSPRASLLHLVGLYKVLSFLTVKKSPSPSPFLMGQV